MVSIKNEKKILDSAKIRTLIRIYKFVKDSDNLKQPAYQFAQMGIVDTLNLYIHFPDMVDISLILHTWNTMKLFVIKCLKI